MWLSIVNLASSQSNSGLIIMFAIPTIVFTIMYLNNRPKRTEEKEEKYEPHHDWIVNLETQLKRFKMHHHRIEEMGMGFEIIREKMDFKNPKKNA